MADIEVTYRGVPVPLGEFGNWDTWNDTALNAFKAGVDAALGAEDAEPAKRGPRVFHEGDVIPEDVKQVRDVDGSDAYRTADGGWRYTPGCVEGWTSFTSDEFPLTEVIGEG